MPARRAVVMSRRQRMIESNLRLVVKISRRYIVVDLRFGSIEDSLGLIFVEKFDPDLGFASTYATCGYARP
jgi:RNA polymerase nonessential primary-like sigma factor